MSKTYTVKTEIAISEGSPTYKRAERLYNVFSPNSGEHKGIAWCDLSEATKRGFVALAVHWQNIDLGLVEDE